MTFRTLAWTRCVSRPAVRSASSRRHSAARRSTNARSSGAAACNPCWAFAVSGVRGTIVGPSA
eukprot:2410666-Alexandrium_andersonii.AAC.1